MSTKIDPITRSVVQHRLSSIVKEMGEAMLRTSYSQILNSSRDFSLAICDTDAPPDRAGRSPSGSCRRAAVGDDRGRGAVQGRQARRRHPAQRSLSRRQPSARSDRLRAGLRRRASGCSGPSCARIRAISAARTHGAYNPGGHRDLAGRPARSADQALRGRQAARRSARSAGAERPQPPRISRRPRGDAGRGASRRAARVATVRRIRRAGRRSRDRGHSRRDRAADPRRGLDLEGRRVPRRGVSRR